MLVVRSADAIPPGSRGCSIAWGMFDGVHLGHQHVLRLALTEARVRGGKAVALTFDPHPQSVVCPEKAPRLLQPLSQRLRDLAAVGIDVALVLEFTPELSRVPGQEFVERLLATAPGVHSLSVGEGFQFGAQRSGDIGLLRRMGLERGFAVHVAQPVSLGGEVVSSSRIRQSLREGDLEHVSELLGRPYAVSGTVVRGDQLGRTLGFPTANLAVQGLELPPQGVYAARVRILSDTPGAAVPAVLNWGIRPTLERPAGEGRFEVHLLGHEGDLYGRELEVTFVGFLRAESRFDSVDALRSQIGRDCIAARNILG